MPDIRELTKGNTIAREHLRSLVQRLTDQELSVPMPAGWTPSAVLAHLAFWDQRALLLIRKWRTEGIGPSPTDFDILNDATLPLCLAIPPRVAAELALATAAAIDQEIERLEPVFAERIEVDGKSVHLNRAPHRNGHIEDIERALAATNATR